MSYSPAVRNEDSIVWIIRIYLVDYLWVKSQANVCLREVWKLGTFNNLTFYYTVTTWKGPRKCHGRVMEKSLNFILGFLYEPCPGIANLWKINPMIGIVFLVMFSSSKAFWTRTIANTEEMTHRSWWHMKCAQHAAHNLKLIKMQLFRHPLWYLRILKSSSTWLKVVTI